MRLYGRDFNTLTEDERTEWEAVRKREIVSSGTLEVRRSLFREYPKAARHFRSLFPNNYLDPCELQDAETLTTCIQGFRELLDSGEGERGLQNYLKSHESYWIVGSLFGYTTTGHHEACLFREFPLGNSHVVDYVLAGRGSGGWQFVFVEFESPNGRTTRIDGHDGEAARKGERQANDWAVWLEQHFPSLNEVFSKAKNPDHSLPAEFFRYDSTRIHFVVVTGRRTDYQDVTYRNRRKKQREMRLLHLHYDNLLDASEALIGKATY